MTLRTGELGRRVVAYQPRTDLFHLLLTSDGRSLCGKQRWDDTDRLARLETYTGHANGRVCRVCKRRWLLDHDPDVSQVSGPLDVVPPVPAPRTGPTHADLCRVAGTWLRRQGCTVVLVEPQTLRTSEYPDAIGWTWAHFSWLVEVKVSRDDFRRDVKKLHRQVRGMGQLRFYLTPEGLLTPSDIPDGWGLLEVQGKRVVTVKPHPRFNEHGNLVNHASDPAITALELPLLIAQLERLQQGRPIHVHPTPTTYLHTKTAYR